MTDLTRYFEQAGISLDEVALCFHQPVERAFAHFLPVIAQDDPELLEAYQSTHSDRASALLGTRKYMASFVGLPSGMMVFAGLFEVRGSQQRPVSEIAAIPAVQRLYDEYGVDAEFFDGFSQSWLWFDLQRTQYLADLIGRLQIARPLERNYMRRAENCTDLPVDVMDTTNMTVGVPRWQDVIMVAREVRTMPPLWAETLNGWRGVYLITLESNGARFVGRTCEGETLLSRWRADVEGNTSGTLAARNPEKFRFSILELADHTQSQAQIDEMAEAWVERLHTRRFGLNAR